MNRLLFIRSYDLFISSFLLIVLLPLLFFIYIICLFETGKPIFVQQRVGKYQKSFLLFKFRTMKVNTPSLASHLVNKSYITRFGAILRLTKMDELPQLFNVLKGDMSLVGPRPCLFNQHELIIERAKYNLFNVKPGITGLAQIKGIDMSNPERLARVDYNMIANLNFISYFKYLILTFYGKGIGDKTTN